MGAGGLLRCATGAYGCGRHAPIACWAFVGTTSISLFHTCAVYMGIQSAVIRVVYFHMYICDGASTVRPCLVQSTWRWKCSIMAFSTFRQTACRPRMRWPWLKPSTSVLYFSHGKDTRSHTLALNRGERKDLAMTFGWDVVCERAQLGGCCWRDACRHSNYHFLSFFSTCCGNNT